MKDITTLGELKKSGYRSRSIKEELRENLIRKLSKKEKVFEGILGGQVARAYLLKTGIK